MNSDNIDVVADALAEAWRSGGSVAPLDEASWPTTLAEAYRVQDALNSRLGYELAGWKIGITNRAGMKTHGLDHPVMVGRLYRQFTQDSPGRFRMADFRNAPMVEGEFAFRLGRDLPPRDAPYSEAEVREAVSAVIMTVDAVDTRWGVHPFVRVSSDGGGTWTDWVRVDVAVTEGQGNVGDIELAFDSAHSARPGPEAGQTRRRLGVRRRAVHLPGQAARGTAEERRVQPGGDHGARAR